MRAIKRLLIANRGEIAVRVIRTAKAMGMVTIAIYSDADAESLHRHEAHQAIRLSGLSASDTYLNIDKVLAAAKQVGADAIHPGYGFLSENADFAQACTEHSIIFVGPGAKAIELMGSKLESKLAMQKIDIPCIAGYHGDNQNVDFLTAKAEEIGVPLMIKAAAGGGGRGMRLINDLDNFKSELDAAKTEALNAFASDTVILEKALIEARHIEIQLIADQHGNVVHLGERDCSIQRRHQKIVEEAPSPVVNAELRRAMGEEAVKVAKACNYVGAGTVEFLLDRDENFYFLEMNTRLQVEHPVSEMVTGLDLVRLQLEVAAGMPLRLSQDQISIQGHAVEVRLYAEDPRRDFMPQTGEIIEWQAHPSLRVDSGIRVGQQVTPYYDPMLAKLIVHGETRKQALAKLQLGVEHSYLLGVNHNLNFLAGLLANDDFIENGATTAFLDKHYVGDEYQASKPHVASIAMAALAVYRKTQFTQIYDAQGWGSAWSATSTVLLESNEKRWRIVIQSTGEDSYLVNIDDRQLSVVWPWQDSLEQRLTIDDNAHFVAHASQADSIYLQDKHGHTLFRDVTYAPAQTHNAALETDIKASMDGVIVEVNAKVGDYVSEGQLLVVLEAMKMAHQFKATTSGLVEEVLITVGQQVKTRQLMLRLEQVKHGSSQARDHA